MHPPISSSNALKITIKRMKKRDEFLRAASQGSKTSSKGLVLQALPSPPGNENTITIGFTVSGKVGNAVIRNRVRRRLKSLVLQLFTLHATPGYDYVVIGRLAALDREYELLGKDIKYCLHSLELYRKN